jgi:predicted RND superfamily exporter protein
VALKHPSDVRIEAKASAWCMRHPAATILGAAFLIALSAWAAGKTHVDPSPERYLIGTEVWSTYQKIDREYDISETAVIAFRELGGTVFDVETVSSVATLDRMLADMPEVERVLSIASATALDRENDALDLTPLLPAGPITRDTAIKLATRIRRHPVYSKALVDDQHETTFIFVQLSREVTDPIRRVEAVRQIREKADTFRAKHRTVHFAGSLFTKEAIATAAQRDTVIYFPILTLLLALSLWLVFGEAIACVVPLSVIGFSTTIAFALLGALRVPLNLSTAQIPAIILAAGLASSITFLAELRRQHARTNDPDASLVATIEGLASPSLLTTAAAVTAFLALGRSPVTPIRELGYAGALGCFAVYVSTFFVTPAVLRTLRYPRRPTRPFASAQWIGKTTIKIAQAVQRRMISTIAVVGLLSGVSIAALSLVRIDSNFAGYLDPDHRLRQDMAVIERTLGGSDTIELILDGDEDGYFKEIDALVLLDRLGQTLETLPGIHTAFSLADYLKIANAVMIGERNGALELPKSSEAVAQLTVIDPTPFSAFATSEMREARVALQIHSLSSEGLLQLAASAKEKADQTLEGKNITSFVTGLPIVWARLARYVVDNASWAFSISALFIWAVMIIGLRSVTIGTASMVPNLLAAMFTLGTMAIFGVALDANLVFLLALATALSAYHGIQIAARYQRAREEGSPSPEAAATYALTHGGHPVAVTSLLLLIGFGVLCISSFLPTRETGMIGAILAVWAFVLDLVLLPALLMTAESILNRYAPPKISTSTRPNGKSERLQRDSLIPKPTIEKEEDPARTTDSPNR